MITRNGDVVLIHHKNEPMVYARVEDIVADVKPGWWQITLLFLTVPRSTVTWILREGYIDGDEFTMNGEAMRLERLPRSEARKAPEPEPSPPGAEGGGEKVVSLAARRRDGR
ncbi:conserved hypothetical protein [Desulfarculus baarsii DSM 2075]|uniref:Uncharacterized protein n=1 Tax=Desulfarculus baarsii (strain ATCC 33931 / DSM 2075 / LMG 7858 / VKM B-1802 / 2st14) TaxID=644282 RepID=E1QL35_DESB2|nr:hypothetical protein [Desulfarculus baarsii]ADK85300.1 conserved hypothetical protein [Desulfarculus baarsii DSM 2075]